MTLPTLIVEFDWDVNGSFEADETANVHELQIQRGRSSIRELDPIARATIILRNDDKRFSPMNASSPLYNDTGGIGAEVRIRTTSPVAKTLFRGFVQTLNLEVALDRRVAVVTALDRMAKELRDVEAAYTSRTVIDKTAATTHQLQVDIFGDGPKTGHAIRAILDAAGMADADHTLQDGETELDTYALDGGNPLGAIDEITEEEGGRRFALGDGVFVFHGRLYRYEFAQRLSNQTYSDGATAAYRYDDLQLMDWNQDEVINAVLATPNPLKFSADQEVWTLAVPEDSAGAKIGFPIQPGEALELYATFALPASVQGVGSGYAANTKPDGTGRDMTSDVAKVLGTLEAHRQKITFTNNASVVAYLTSATLKVVTREPLDVESPHIDKVDAASVTRHGRRVHGFQPTWVGKREVAERWAEYILHKHADPISHIGMQFVAYDDTVLTEMLTRELDERVKVVNVESGMTGGEEFFIEGVEHLLLAGRGDPIWRTNYVLSRVRDGDTFWILADATLGKLDTTTRLG